MGFFFKKYITSVLSARSRTFSLSRDRHVHESVPFSVVKRKKLARVLDVAFCSQAAWYIYHSLGAESGASHVVSYEVITICWVLITV